MEWFGTKIVSPNGDVVGLFKSPTDAAEAQRLHWSFAGEIRQASYLVESDELSIRRDADGQVIGCW